MMKTAISNEDHLLKEESKRLILALKRKGVNEDVIFDIHVAFEEALRNAMIHGNKMDPEKRVMIETKMDSEAVTIYVEDEGDGFNADSLPDPTLDENLLKESGRGVYLIKHLMDEVRYEKSGRKIIMKKYLRKKHL